MPRFKITADETRQLAGYLNANADKPKDTPALMDGTLIERGRKLVQSSGCLNCHPLKLENQFATKSLSELATDRWKGGCLSDSLGDTSNAPQYSFSPAEREALQAFAATDRSSLARHVPAEFAERQIRLSNCHECHGKFDGIPALDTAGAKLKPEWTKALLAGEVAYKPRPWLDARMPAFPKWGEGLAEGMAMQHGYPSKTRAEPPVDMEAAKIGQTLISSVGGFSCISCHGVGEMSAAQVFEAPGINLVYSSDRLLKPYLQRWLRSPIQVDPSTKMPAYFDEEGKSPLADVYEGNGTKQIEAIWQYLRLGDKMPPPPTQ
jgi:mono/diheme cytochrome c family protein